MIELPIDEFVARVTAGRLPDAKTIIAGYWLKDNLRWPTRQRTSASAAGGGPRRSRHDLELKQADQLGTACLRGLHRLGQLVRCRGGRPERDDAADDRRHRADQHRRFHPKDADEQEHQHDGAAAAPACPTE